MSERDLALVTGAAGGNGLEVARRLADRGYGVIAVERDENLEAAATSSGVAAVPVARDFSNRTKKLELYHPYSDSVLSRFLQDFPWMLPRLPGPLEWMGRRGLKKYRVTAVVTS